MKFLIVFSLAIATVLAKDLYFRSIEVPVRENEGRITNGIIAKQGEIYYQVGLDLKKPSYTKWCGGSFIGNNWVLTAAHCTDHASLATVYLGATQRFNAEKIWHAPKSDMLIHPDFNPQTLENDISLIRIPTTSESDRTEIVRIPSNNDLKYIGDIVVISGWGYMNDNSKVLSINLRYGILKVSPASVCSTYEYGFNDDTNICVATPNRVSICNGDSGGPLVLDGQNLQIGISSFSSNFGCAKGRPIVFTRVSAYLPWIKLYTGIDY